EPVRYDAATDRYLPISWDAAFALALCSRNWVTLCRAKNLASTRRLVASQLTALAPFSQTLTAPDSGESPQAQPGQSKRLCCLVLSTPCLFLLGCPLTSDGRLSLSNGPQPAAGPLSILSCVLRLCNQLIRFTKCGRVDQSIAKRLFESFIRHPAFFGRNT